MTQHAPHDPHASHGHQADAHDHPKRSTFITIWLVLGFLTVVEVFVPQVYNSSWNHTTKMLLLVLLATGKALLVALYFMHLKWETPWVRRIAMFPAYMGFAAVVLMLEEHFRPMVSG